MFCQRNVHFLAWTPFFLKWHRPPVRIKRSTVGTWKIKILYDNASLTKSWSLCHTRISKISVFSSRTLQQSHNKTKSWPTSATSLWLLSILKSESRRVGGESGHGYRPCQSHDFRIWNRTRLRAFVQNQHIKELISARKLSHKHHNKDLKQNGC